MSIGVSKEESSGRFIDDGGIPPFVGKNEE